MYAIVISIQFSFDTVFQLIVSNKEQVPSSVEKSNINWLNSTLDTFKTNCKKLLLK